MADTAILAAGGANAPLTYKVPGAAILTIKQVHVKYIDNGASGDWLPAVRIVNDAGHTMGTAADQGVKVTSGSDADVSFFPGVKHTAAATVLTSGALWGDVSGLVIPSGVATEVVFGSWTSAPGSQHPLTFVTGVTLNTIKIQEYRVFLELTITWPAGAYDRYIEFAPPGATSSTGEMVVRERGATTPTDDRQVITAVLAGDPVTPVALNMSAFQSSGADKTVSGSFVAYGWPRILGSLYG